jgi:hypothetical protein
MYAAPIIRWIELERAGVGGVGDLTSTWEELGIDWKGTDHTLNTRARPLGILNHLVAVPFYAS